MFEAYTITLIGVIAAQASPGPNLFAVASAALGQGRMPGLSVTLGVSTGMMIWAVAVAYGLGVVFAVYPVSLILLKLVGGAYLLWLASRALRSVLSSGGASSIDADSDKRSNIEHWQRGLFVVLTNPKAALMWSAVATILHGAALETWQVALFGPVAAISAFMIYGTYALLFSTGAANKFYKRFTQWIEAAFSASFGALGSKLVIEGARELRE